MHVAMRLAAGARHGSSAQSARMAEPSTPARIAPSDPPTPPLPGSAPPAPSPVAPPLPAEAATDPSCREPEGDPQPASLASTTSPRRARPKQGLGSLNRCSSCLSLVNMPACYQRKGSLNSRLALKEMCRNPGYLRRPCAALSSSFHRCFLGRGQVRVGDGTVVIRLLAVDSVRANGACLTDAPGV